MFRGDIGKPPEVSKRKPLLGLPIYFFTSAAKAGSKSMSLIPASVLGYDSILCPFLLRCWPAAESFQAVVRQPNSDDDQSRRSIEEIPQEEIALAMRNLVRDSLSIERDKLLLLVARIFGFERAGNHIQKTLANTFDDLVESGQLTFIEDRVSLPN